MATLFQIFDEYQTAKSQYVAKLNELDGKLREQNATQNFNTYLINGVPVVPGVPNFAPLLEAKPTIPQDAIVLQDI